MSEEIFLLSINIMKHILLSLLFLTSFFILNANSTNKKSHAVFSEQSFCDGWKDGYKEGFTYYNSVNGKIKPIFITPICPIASIGYNTYKDGYNRGLLIGQQDFKKRNPTINDNDRPIIVSRGNSDDKRSFRDGWKDGYKDGYTYYNASKGKMKPIFITPICPIAGIGYDTYKDGYNRGQLKGRQDFKKKNPNIDDGDDPIVVSPRNSNNERSFRDGWKDGYEDGYTYHNSVNSKMKPIFITPICPIARIGFNTYSDGFTRGRKQGIEDFKKRL